MLFASCGMNTFAVVPPPSRGARCDRQRAFVHRIESLTDIVQSYMWLSVAGFVLF